MAHPWMLFRFDSGVRISPVGRSFEFIRKDMIRNARNQLLRAPTGSNFTPVGMMGAINSMPVDEGKERAEVISQ